jgi:hypothetical protein
LFDLGRMAMSVSASLAAFSLLLGASAAAAASSSASFDGIGDQLLRTFFVFKKQPLTRAAATGWVGFNGYGGGACTEQLGHVLAMSDGGPTKGDPTMLLFTSGGQLAGFGVRAWGLDPLGPQVMGEGKFWLPAPNTSKSAAVYDLFVLFRASEMLCSGKTDSRPLGDRVSINGNFTVPLDNATAAAKGFYPGNCIKKMGTHWWYDLETHPRMSWNAQTLLPVLPMYLNAPGPHQGKIHAVLVATPNAQRIEPFGDYEGPFTSKLFCLNACKKDGAECDKFSNVGGLWTTMHWEFSDPALATCEHAACAL